MKEGKLLDTTKPEIQKLEESQPYDPEVEKKRLEVYESVQKGWQGLADKGMDTLNEILGSAEKRGLHKLLLLMCVVLAIFISTAFLTYKEIVSGEAFMFFVGILVGYLLAYSLPKIQF